MGQRFLRFGNRFGSPVRRRTRTVETALNHYLRGLRQAESKKRERLDEVVPAADHQALPHLLRESAWEERAVLDPVAREATRSVGGDLDSSLIIDESGGPQKGQHSAGVARQGCGQLGKVENCQGGGVAALGRGAEAPLIEERWFLPESWPADPERCPAAGIPSEHRDFKRKHALAVEMMTPARQQGIGFAGVGFDGCYGSDPALLRPRDDQGEMFVGAVHTDQRLYLDDPQPRVPPPATPRSRPPTRRQAPTPAVRVERWAPPPPAEAWQRVPVRDGTTGLWHGERLHHRVGVWDGNEPQARPWHGIVRRAVETPTEITYSRSNAPGDTRAPRLAFMQGQRYWRERVLPQGTQDVGLGDAQVRSWRGWHPHLALVMMAMLVTLEARRLHPHTHPLLSGTDSRALLNQVLPRRDTTVEAVLRQLEVRHRQRQAAIDSAHRRQPLNE